MIAGRIGRNFKARKSIREGGCGATIYQGLRVFVSWPSSRFLSLNLPVALLLDRLSLPTTTVYMPPPLGRCGRSDDLQFKLVVPTVQARSDTALFTSCGMCKKSIPSRFLGGCYSPLFTPAAHRPLVAVDKQLFPHLPRAYHTSDASARLCSSSTFVGVRFEQNRRLHINHPAAVGSYRCRGS